MKTFASITLAICLLVGCATGPNAYEIDALKSIQATAQTVDLSRQGWNDYVAAGHAGTNEVRQVHDAYAKYQAAMALAQVEVAAYHAHPTNQMSLEASLSVLSTESGNVIGAISTLKK